VLRSHTCGELTTEHAEQDVKVCGWVNNYRDHGGLIFIDLRDRYGLIQVVFDPKDSVEAHELAGSLRNEDVIQANGVLRLRAEDLINPNIASGKLEIRAKELIIHNKSKTPPFEPTGENIPNEELRLKYRYVDLRRPQLQEAMKLRHQLCKATRDYFNGLDFLEIETPIMGKSTPEGARDYLVASRVHPGEFYALPQSPQLYKQLLMVGGLDRYYQIARCFRDEDLRADRQPEFTQIDVEMSFVEQEDILTTIDGLVAAMVKEVRGIDIELPLPRLTYAESMERFGNDKPDMRFGMELADISDIAAKCGFGVFNKTIENGGKVRGLNAKGAAEKYSRKMIDELTAWVGDFGAKGLAFFRVKEGALDSPIAKFFSEGEQQAIIEMLGGENGDLLFFVADTAKVVSAALSNLRVRLGKELELYDPMDVNVLWIVEFPLYSWSDEENRWQAEHHPFCYPNVEDLEKFDTDPGSMRAQSYDLVCNGYEAASGSVRVHDPQVQQKIFNFIGIAEEEAEERFGFLLNALRYGAPPHAGIALGLDRWIMIFLANDNIRDVIAFPKTQKASDLMSEAPSCVDLQQLDDLSIKLNLPED
jgi:aspartyl-tRNA synthetase